MTVADVVCLEYFYLFVVEKQFVGFMLWRRLAILEQSQEIVVIIEYDTNIVQVIDFVK